MNALLGTVNALLSLIDARLPARSPRALVACMGAEQAAYRVRLYPPYHAHREPMPPELAAQWELAPTLLESLGWTVSASDELEADDVMFSFARAEADARRAALLLTGDRDLYGAVERARRRARAAQGRRPRRNRSGGGARALRRRPRAGAGLHRPARRSLRRPARRPWDRRQDRRGAAAPHGSLEGVLLAAHESQAPEQLAGSRRCARAPPLRCARTRSCCARSSRSPPCSRSRSNPRPTARPTSRAARARPRELGMKRLAERLEELGATA